MYLTKCMRRKEMHEKMPCLQHVKSRCESLQVDWKRRPEFEVLPNWQWGIFSFCFSLISSGLDSKAAPKSRSVHWVWKQKLKSAPPLLVLGTGKGLLQVRESGRNQHLPVSVMLICNFQEISSFLICQSTGIKLFIIFHYYFDFLNIFLVMPYFSFQILFSHVFFIFDQSS